MRSHGVPEFPDLTNPDVVHGDLPKLTISMQQIGVSSSQFQTAEDACRRLLPEGGGAPMPTESQQDQRDMLRFARCMRSDGVPGWPDPANGPAGWGFNLLHVQGFDPNSPQIDNKMHQCQQMLPKGVSIPLSRPGHAG